MWHSWRAHYEGVQKKPLSNHNGLDVLRVCRTDAIVCALASLSRRALPPSILRCEVDRYLNGRQTNILSVCPPASLDVDSSVGMSAVFQRTKKRFLAGCENALISILQTVKANVHRFCSGLDQCSVVRLWFWLDPNTWVHGIRWDGYSWDMDGSSIY